MSKNVFSITTGYVFHTYNRSDLFMMQEPGAFNAHDPVHNIAPDGHEVLPGEDGPIRRF